MALTLGDNFSYQGAKPLDARLTYSTVASMKSVADATMYEGCLAYCIATAKTYQWKSTNTVDETTGKWREFTSGGGSAIILTQTLVANATSVTFQNIPTTGNHLIDFFIDGGANYTAIDTSTAGQVTLTYEAVASARTVYCKIEEVS